MRVLLIYPNTIESPKEISAGMASLSATLKEDGHTTGLIDTTFGGRSDENILAQVRRFSPQLVCISIATNEFKFCVHICDLIKGTYPDVPIIAGGYHPTMAPEETLGMKSVDMICVGEGDFPIRDVARMVASGTARTDILNIWFKKGNETIKNGQRQLPNLDELPVPDYSIFDMQRYIDWKGGIATVISTRGCPYPCTYCINRKQKEIYKGSGLFVRYKSVDKILAEIQQLTSNYKIKEVLFNDDTFTLDPKRVEEFCTKYPAVIGAVPFTINGRVNAVTRESLLQLGKAGCVRINFGIECGNEYIRNKILERNMSDKELIDTFQWARDAGIETYGFVMIGLPYETEENIWESIELCRKINADYVGCTIFTALPGTPLYDLCKNQGWLKEEYGTSYFQDTNVDHPNFTLTRLKWFRDHFGFEVFRKTRPLRAYVDLVDKSFTKYESYMWIRARLIEAGAKKLLSKLDPQNFYDVKESRIEAVT